MIVPTSTAMKLKFPEFASTPDATVEFAIADASRHVDDTWLVGDQTAAVMWLAAHYLMVTISRTESGSGQMISSERWGEMSITYKTPEMPTALSYSDYTTTPYGTRYRELLALNQPAVAII